MQGPQRLYLLGPISNFVDNPGASPAEHAHREGLTFVAMDSRAYPYFRGETPSGEWVVSRKVLGQFPQLDPWPKTGWRFDNEAGARDSYQKMRAHVLMKLQGAQPRDDRTLERRLNDPATAWSEAISWQGQDAVELSCDRTTEARILEMLTDRLEPFPVRGSAPPGGQPVKLASYSSQVSPHVIAIGMGPGGVADHVVVAFTPANESELIAQGLVGSACDTKPFALEVPSGILALAWGRVDSAGFFANAPGQDPAVVLANLIGNNVAQPLRTPFDNNAPTPVAWGIRVRPGSYRAALRFLETPEGISAMAISHVQAPPLFPDMGGGPPPS